MKRLEDYKIDEMIRERTDREREISNDSYASKIIERIVLGFLTLFSLGVLGYLGNLIIKVISKTP